MSESSKDKSFRTWLGKIPLQTVLIVPFIVLIVVTVGLVGYLSFRNGQQAVNDVVDQLQTEITARINDHLQTLLATPHLLNTFEANTIALNEVNLQDAEAAQQHFWKNIQSFQGLNASFIGTERGDMYGVRRPDVDTIEVMVLMKIRQAV